MEERSEHSSTSDINSEEAAKTEHLIIPRKKRICLVGASGDDPALSHAAQQFGVPVIKSKTGVEYVDDTTYCTYFILKHFEGQEYDLLHKTAHRILGPTALLQLAEKKESLPSINRPMYTQAMLGTVIVFTGFRKKEELTILINKIHHMGGSVRKEISQKVTHLIANCCGGEKYRYAVTFSVPIMSVDWVTALWDMRNNITSVSASEEVIALYKLKPFFGARVCFFGFPEEEKRHMCEVLQQQGGEATEINDPNCTHVVIDLNKFCKYIMKKDKQLPPHTKPSNADALQQPEIIFDAKKDQKRAIYNRCPSYFYIFYEPFANTIANSAMVIFSSDISTHYKRKHSSNESSCSDEFLENDDDLVPYEDMSNKTYTMSKKESIRVAFKEICEKHQEEESNIMFELREPWYASTHLENAETDDDFEDIDEDSVTTMTQKQSRKIGSDEQNTTPRRYVKCRKSSNWNAILKQTTPCSSRLSYSALVRQYSYRINGKYINDTIESLNTSDASEAISDVSRKSFKTPKVLSRAIKHSSALISKLKEIVIPAILKDRKKITQYRPNQQEKLDRKRNDKETKAVHQKYTRIQSPVPVPKKLARFNSNSMRSSRTTQQQILQQRRQNKMKKSQKKQLPQQGMKKAISAPSMIDEQWKDQFSTMVVDESNVNSLPDLAYARAHIVKAEWFWTSIQNEGAADEKEYLFEDYLETVMSPSASARRDSIQQTSTPTAASSRRKRKRLADTLSSLVQNGTDSPALHKRRSSISDAGHLSVSGSFLDCTASPDKQLLDDIPEVEAVNPESSRKLSPRHQVFLELLQTESNYVGILSTIMTLFKSPLEQLIETGGELLNSTEAKIIFGNFPPIYEVHKKMLEELRFCASHWSEENSIGKIFLKYAPDLIKAYPPYVNFFENTKEMLDQCDQNKPRFHAFLKICQSKPECGRQSLKELLIKPVQRLPSISLLLNDILKHTKENNPDRVALEKSLSSIKEVMTYINEDKRKTEGQLAIFDIYQEIDNCPAHLVSSHRSFINKCDVQELSEGLSGRGDHLVLFLFTDMLEICKKRSKAFNSMKSPNTVNGLHTVKTSQGKLYKHIKMLSLSTVKKVFDIRETEECRNVFALLVRSNEELKEKLYSFTISDEEINKTNFLRTLCRQMANTVCKADADTFLTSLDAHHLQIDTSDVALGTLSKAFKFANRTRMKVGRAFSFNKTPSKLKRAMSTMMSPFGSTTSLTPASQQLAQMRLASCNNINELGNGGSGSPSRDDVLVAPLSVQPTRKAKCSTLSVASLRRNCSDDVLKDESDI